MLRIRQGLGKTPSSGTLTPVPFNFKLNRSGILSLGGGRWESGFGMDCAIFCTAMNFCIHYVEIISGNVIINKKF